MNGQCGCGRWFTVQPRGARRLYCDKCRQDNNRAAASKWRAANPEKHHQNNRDWYVANRADDERWREENKKRAKAWRKNNAEWVKVYTQNRGRTGQFSPI